MLLQGGGKPGERLKARFCGREVAEFLPLPFQHEFMGSAWNTYLPEGREEWGLPSSVSQEVGEVRVNLWASEPTCIYWKVLATSARPGWLRSVLGAVSKVIRSTRTNHTWTGGLRTSEEEISMLVIFWETQTCLRGLKRLDIRYFDNVAYICCQNQVKNGK